MNAPAGVPRPTGAVSRTRPFPSNGEYRQNPPMKNRISWIKHLVLSERELDIFLQQVMWSLRYRKVLQVPFTTNKGKEVFNKFALWLMQHRPDIFPPGSTLMTRARGREIVKNIVSRLRTEVNKGQFSSEFQAILQQRVNSPAEPEIEPSVTVSSATAAPPLLASHVAIPSVGSPARVAPSVSAPSVLSPQPLLPFNQNRITIDVVHHTQPGWVVTVHLEDLVQPEKGRFDLQDCCDVLLLRLHSQLSRKEFIPGSKFFKLDTEVLWCTVEGMPRIIDDQAAFENACSRNIAACLREDTNRRPSIQFSTRRRGSREVRELTPAEHSTVSLRQAAQPSGRPAYQPTFRSSTSRVPDSEHPHRMGSREHHGNATQGSMRPTNSRLGLDGAIETQFHIADSITVRPDVDEELDSSSPVRMDEWNDTTRASAMSAKENVPISQRKPLREHRPKPQPRTFAGFTPAASQSTTYGSSWPAFPDWFNQGAELAS